MRKFLLRHAELEEIRTGEELDIFPRDELIGKIIREEPTEDLIDEPLPSHSPHQSSKPHIDVDQPEMGIDSKKVEIIDPYHLCPEGIDDLFVHHLLPEEDNIFFRKGWLQGTELVFRKGDLGLDSNRSSPRGGKTSSLFPLSG